jgi:hypothetical protein
MNNDIFIMIPCHVEENFSTITELKVNTCEYSEKYLKTLNIITKSEIVDRFSKSFQRYFLGEQVLEVLSDECDDDFEDKPTIEEVNIRLFLSGCEKNRLAVLTVVINDYKGNPTTILDQVTREEIAIKGKKRLEIGEFVFNNFNLIKNGEAKVCLIQNEKSSDEEILYYMAQETSASDLTDLSNTKIISDSYYKLARDNVAVYDFSDIYVSTSVIYQVIYELDFETKLYYEGLLIFIVELLVMQLSAVYRTNNKVQKALEENQSISVKDYEIFSNEFANTLSIWQINIYRYNGAQTVANTIAERFEIDKVRENYKQNDELLQNIINTRNVKNAMKESNILFYVAILLFIKDFYLIVKSIVLFLLGNQDFEFSDFFALPTSIVTLLFVLLIYHGRFKTLGKKR